MGSRRLSDGRDEMRAITDSRYLHLFIRFLIGGLFIYAGLGNIMAPLEFAVAIRNYDLVPLWSIGIIAATLPWVEVLAGLGLVLGVRIKACSLIISSLLVVFILIIIIAYLRGLDVECGCFRGVDRKVGPLVIIEDLLMLLGALLIYFHNGPRRSDGDLLEHPS